MAVEEYWGLSRTGLFKVHNNSRNSIRKLHRNSFKEKVHSVKKAKYKSKPSNTILLEKTKT